jgi:hypothetical protein
MKKVILSLLLATSSYALVAGTKCYTVLNDVHCFTKEVNKPEKGCTLYAYSKNDKVRTMFVICG